MRKLIGTLVLLIVAVVVVLCLVLGKDTVAEITDSVLDAAKEELSSQIQAKLEEYRVDVLEVKPVIGQLNDDGGKYQFYCAVLIQTNTESNAADCANALQKLFTEAGYCLQTGPEVVSDSLVYKSITYKQTDYSEGGYYTVYVYIPAVGDKIDLDALAEKLSKK